MSNASKSEIDIPPRRAPCLCGASVHEGARFCWMCGAPVSPQATETMVINDDNAGEPNSASAATDLQIVAWLALPVSFAVIFGLYLVEPAYAVVVGPALVLGTLASLVHSTIMRKAASPQTKAQRAVTTTTSIAVGAMTFAGTFAITMLIIVVVVAVAIISLCAGLMELCGIK